MAGLARVGSRVSILSRHSQSSYKKQVKLTEQDRLFPGGQQAEEAKRLSLSALYNTDLDDLPDTAVCAEIIEARKQALNSWDFLQRSSQIFNRSRLATCLLVTYSVLPLSMIFMGIKYLDACPKEEKIPIYLLVGGCFGLVKLVSLLWGQAKYKSYEPIEDEEAALDPEATWWRVFSTDIAHGLLTCFLAAWFCVGNYWVFRIWPPKYTQDIHQPKDWCDKAVYVYSVAQIISFQVTIASVFLVILFLFCFYKCRCRKN